MPSSTTLIHLAASMLYAAAASAQSQSTYPQFSREIMAKATKNMIATSTHSWERGTMMEAIIEQETPSLSVFGARKVPVRKSEGPLPAAALASLDEMLAARSIELKPFASDAAAADPASVGVTSIMQGIFTNLAKYTRPVTDQVNYLLLDVSRDEHGLISHRRDEFQTWADFVAMVPPLLAYKGAALGGSEGGKLLQESYEQIKGYRNAMRDPKTNLWHHILRGSWNDTGLWATGQGWAAFGMLRCQQTMVKSSLAPSLKSQSKDLLAWANELIHATWNFQLESGAVYNYINLEDFEDSTGTAIVAAASYRYALITKTKVHPGAEKALQRMIDLTFDDGWLQNTTDPYYFDKPGPHSPEAQSFIVMLDAASREYHELYGYNGEQGGSDGAEVGAEVEVEVGVESGAQIGADAEVGAEADEVNADEAEVNAEAEAAPENDADAEATPEVEVEVRRSRRHRRRMY